MKKSVIIPAGLAALAATGSILAYRSAESSPLEAKSRIHATKEMSRKAPVRQVTAGYDLWIVDVQSYFGEDSNFTFDQGPKREYSAEVQLSGNKAKIKGLFDLWFDDVEKEYVLEGDYDQRAGTITIPVAQYDSDKRGIDGYTKAAEMYSLADNRPYTLVIFSGNMDQGGTQNTIQDLVLSVSDNLDKITARNGFGLFAFDEYGNKMAYYDCYKSCALSTPVEGVKLTTTTPDVNFSGRYITDGLEQKTTVNVLNRGDRETEVTVRTTNPDLIVATPSFRMASGERKPIELAINASQVGRFDEDVILAYADGQELNVHVGVDVHVRPDYTLITKEESAPLEYEMSPYAPFVIDEIDGRTVAVSINEGSGSESWFTATVDVPDGKVALFSYKGIQENKAPNGLVVSLDGDRTSLYFDADFTSYNPTPVDGILTIPAGKHTIGFSHSMPMDHYEFSGVHGRCYVYDIEARIYDPADAKAVLDREEVVFECAAFDKLATTRTASVRLFNLSKTPLSVTSCEGTNGFSGEAPSLTAGEGESIDVPLTWTVNSVGEKKGTVIIHTSLGDYKVECLGSAIETPADFHKIVTNGDFSFDTNVEYPFVYQTARNYLYNSTSKSDIDDITNSWLEAIFEVPEGQLGKVAWEALNDSENLFYYMGQPSVISGTTITIDGDNAKSIGGLSANCNGANLYTPGELIFTPGIHRIRFNYKKTFTREESVFGDDRLKLFEISLELVSSSEKKGQVVPEECNFKGLQYSMERDGHQTIGIINYTDTPCELLSWEADGPFSVVDLSEFAYEGTTPFMVEYHPTKTGEESGSVTLHTTIGDYTVPCTASGIDLQRGGRVWYESFEYGADGWLFEDYDNDGMGWMDLSAFFGEHPNDGGFIFGYRGMGVVTYNYGYQSQFDTPMDNVMFSPEIEIPADGTTLLQFLTFSKTWNNDNLEVLVGEDADTYIDMYEQVFERSFTNGINVWTEYAVDITKYAGKKVRIAFRFHTPSAGNTYYLCVDDILVTNSLKAPVSGVEKVTVGESAPVEVLYHTIDGKRVAEPADGLYIKTTRYADGTAKSEKIVIR